VARAKQLFLLAVFIVSWLVPVTTVTARCYDPGATVSRLEKQLREEQALTSKNAYTGVFDPGEKVQIGLLRWYDPNLQRWVNRDPLGERFDKNLYRFSYNSPINVVDPNGLWGVAIGNADGSSYFNIGHGDPTFYFGPDSGNDFKQAAAATADGLNPFGNPFAKHGVYDPNDPYNQFSHGAGKVGQVCLAGAVGSGLWNAAKLPTMSVGWVPGMPPHFFWGVNTSAGSALFQWTAATGASTEVTGIAAGYLGGYLGGGTALTGIPILFPGAAAGVGIPAYNCFTGACGAVRRGIIGF
jgi:RHS repeat-associated protein